MVESDGRMAWDTPMATALPFHPRDFCIGRSGILGTGVNPPADTGGRPPKTDVVITFPAVGLQPDDQGGCAGG